MSHDAVTTEGSDRRRVLARAGHTGDLETARAGLVEPDPRLRSTALGALARIGGLTDAELVEAFGDEDPGVRARAATLAADPTRPAPTGLLTDPAPEVVMAAAWAVGERGRSEGLEALIAVVEGHPDASCREAAVAALGAVGDPIGLAAVLGATKDRAPVRRRALIALAAFDDPAADAALEAALTDKDRSVRAIAEELRA